MGKHAWLSVHSFAASNHLCVDLDYQGSTRRIEPYSLRRTQDGNIILHSFDTDKGEHRSYRIDRITGARTTADSFVPRYEVELTHKGPVRVAPTARRRSSGSPGWTRSPRRSRSTSDLRRSSGPTYIYECSYCGKRFNRKRQNSKIKPHKDKHGHPCSGRTGIWVDSRY